MTRLLIIPVLLLALLLAGCGSGKKQRLAGNCAGHAPTLRRIPTLPGNFPNAHGIDYTGLKHLGSTTIATGFIDGSLGQAHRSFHDALKSTAGYRITHEQQGTAGSVVDFKGNGNTGEVKMTQECRTRTDVMITIRPA